MGIRRYRLAAILFIISLLSIMITPASSSQEGDMDGPPTIRYAEHMWHHDCSNTSGFELNNSVDVSWHHGWAPISGPILCDGERISLFTGPYDGPDYIWYGPLYIYKLPHNFTLGEFHSFEIDFEVDNTEEISRECSVYILLIDSMYKPLLAFHWTDNWEDAYLIGYSTIFWTFSQTKIEYSSNPIYNRTLRYHSNITYDDEVGMQFSMPTMENHHLYTPSDEDLLRQISHIVLMYGGHTSDIPTRTYLHSITLEYDLPVATSLQSPTTNETNPLDSNADIQLSSVATWSVSLFSAAIIIVLSSLIIKDSRKFN
ncbi:MAG: hypothetical protein ACFFEK_08445 [Candidatus Thorarchaeota archaeon]